MPDNNQFAIKKRVIAANQTRKITRAMELVASSRLQRSKARLAQHSLWLQHLQMAAACLSDAYFEPRLKAGAGKPSAYIVFGGSKGLSGYYSPAVFQYALPHTQEQTVLAVGSAAALFFHDALRIPDSEAPSEACTCEIFQAALKLYEAGAVAAVYMIYAKGSKHTVQQLLPLERVGERQQTPILLEPSGQVLYPALYREYLRALVHEAHLHAFLAEQVARVSTMDSATQNADDIIQSLQATYNRMRQSSITQEIITVSNAARGDG